MGGDGITSDEFASVGGPGVEGTLMTYGPDPRNKPGREKGGGRIPRQNSNRKPTRFTAMQACSLSSKPPKPPSSQPQEGGEEVRFRDAVQDGARLSAYDKKGDITKLDYVMYAWKKDPSGKSRTSNARDPTQQGQIGNETSSFSRKTALRRLCEKSGAPVIRSLFCLAQASLAQRMVAPMRLIARMRL